MTGVRCRRWLPTFAQLGSSGDRGLTLMEIIAVTAIIGVTAAIAGASLSFLDDPLETATNDVTGQFRLARVKAMASTSAYRLVPTSSTQILAQYAPNCDATDWTTDAQLSLDLEDSVGITTGWLVCFNSRGTVSTLPNAATPIVLSETANMADTAEIVVFLGGAVETQFSN